MYTEKTTIIYCTTFLLQQLYMYTCGGNLLLSFLVSYAYVIGYYITVGPKISVTKNFCRSPSMTKIKLMKSFLWHINGVTLYCPVVIVMKIKPRKNLTAEIFYRRKIPDLRYFIALSSLRLRQPLWLPQDGSQRLKFLTDLYCTI